MLHPVLAQRHSTLLVVGFWVIHASIMAMLLHVYGDLPWYESAVDGAVYNAVLVVLGFAVWFPVGYARRNCTVPRLVLNNMMVGGGAIIIWLVVSGVVSRLWLGDNPEYVALASRILPLRVVWGIDHFAMIMGMYHFFVFYRDLEQKRLQEEVLKKQIKESELKSLKAQLNPHFLFNSLNSVSALTITNPEGARNMINQLSELLRYALRNKHTDLISVRDELQNIRRYMDIERVRFGDLLIYEEEVDEACLDMKLPAMILQPLFENAIKHGLYESLTPVTVKAKFTLNHDSLDVLLVNNCDASDGSPAGAGLGIKNTVNILRNLYNREGLLRTKPCDGFFEVKLTIPQTL